MNSRLTFNKTSVIIIGRLTVTAAVLAVITCGCFILAGMAAQSADVDIGGKTINQISPGPMGPLRYD